MKRLLQLLTIFSLSIGIFIFLDSEFNSGNSLVLTQPAIDSSLIKTDSFNTSPICVASFQDVSGSIQNNGIVLITSNVFSPYYKEVNRDIELNFGCIADLSAKKLVSVLLPAKKFRRPVLADLRQMNIVAQREEKKRYLDDLNAYYSDSTAFYSERQKLFSQFCYQVDAWVAVYRNNLTKETDIVTVTRIADKVFNYAALKSAKNFLLLNSDGIDSYGRVAKNLSNKAEVILINASGLEHTSIDSLVTRNFQSMEQAISYTLN